MPKTQLEGSFYAADHDAMRDLVTDWIGFPTVTHRMIGEELLYEDDTVYLSLQSAEFSPNALTTFVAMGSIAGDAAAARTHLDRLPPLCARHGVGCVLVASPLDDDEQPAGEDLELEVQVP